MLSSSYHRIRPHNTRRCLKRRRLWFPDSVSGLIDFGPVKSVQRLLVSIGERSVFQKEYRYTMLGARGFSLPLDDLALLSVKAIGVMPGIDPLAWCQHLDGQALSGYVH